MYAQFKKKANYSKTIIIMFTLYIKYITAITKKKKNHQYQEIILILLVYLDGSSADIWPISSTL